VAAALAWLVISRTLVAYLAVDAPEVGLWLRPDDPEVILSLAGRQFDPDKVLSKVGQVGRAKEADDALKAPRSITSTSAAGDAIRIWAETALVHDPLNARALRILGQLAQDAGDEGGATLFMQAAAHRSIREGFALLWLVQKSNEKRDYSAALHFSDALLRTNSRIMALVLPVLGGIAESPEGRGLLEKLLMSNPPWRRAFLAGLPTAVSDARTPLLLLLAVRQGPDPPTLADIRSYVDTLVAHKFYELAYYTWLQFLPPGQLGSAGFLFNGSFELAPSGVPFDWVLRSGTGVTVDITRRPDQAGQRALLVGLGPGRVVLNGGVAQTLLLPPGTYQFEGKYRGEVIGPRGLVWRVSCAGAAGTPIGQSPMLIGATTLWKDVRFSFTVPGAGCRAQVLQLDLDARMPSEQLVSGSLWQDELRISRHD
jgi:hypothetical protein